MPRRFSARARGQRREKMWVTLTGDSTTATANGGSVNTRLTVVGQTVGASVPFNFLSQGGSGTGSTVYATRDFTILATSIYGVEIEDRQEDDGQIAAIVSLGVQGMSQTADLVDLPQFGRDNVPGIWPLVAPYIPTAAGGTVATVYTVNERSKGMRKVKVGQAIYLSTYTLVRVSDTRSLSMPIFVRMLCGL